MATGQKAAHKEKYKANRNAINACAWCGNRMNHAGGPAWTGTWLGSLGSEGELLLLSFNRFTYINNSIARQPRRRPLGRVVFVTEKLAAIPG